MIVAHKIKDITFDHDKMSMNVDGKVISVFIKNISERLYAANEMQRSFYKISPSGYGIHWPLIDEDLSIDAIIKMNS